MNFLKIIKSKMIKIKARIQLKMILKKRINKKYKENIIFIKKIIFNSIFIIILKIFFN